MNSMDVNKAVAAVLVAGIAFMVTGFIADGLVVSENPAKPAIKIEVAQSNAPAAAAPEGPGPILALLANADVKVGESEVQHVCAACHTYNEGGKTLVGPNLYGVVGRKQASEPGLRLFRGDEDAYRHLDLCRAEQVALEARRLRAGHPHGLRRHPERQAARGRDRVPAHAVEVAGAAADRGRHRCRGAEAGRRRRTRGAGPDGGRRAPAATPSFGALVAKADASKGSTIAHGVCAACHTLNKGGPDAGRAQPLERRRTASTAPSRASPTATRFKAKMKGTWTLTRSTTWLRAPMKEVPGTQMAFAGIQQRAAARGCVAYLRTLADTPAPLPK